MNLISELYDTPLNESSLESNGNSFNKISSINSDEHLELSKDELQHNLSSKMSTSNASNKNELCNHCNLYRRNFDFLFQYRNESVPSICGYCASNDKNKNKIKNFLRKNSNRYFCKQCNYLHTNKSAYNKHCWTEHKLKNLKCEKCNATYFDLGSLRKHVNSRHSMHLKKNQFV